MSASQPISVKFEGSEDTLTISEAVAQQYTFFQALVDGGFQESAERTVTLKEISRPIAAVVLQTRNDMLRSVTRETMLECLAALDFLDPKDKPKLLDGISKKILRNRWQEEGRLCRRILDMAFKRPLIRDLLSSSPELTQACAPYLVESGSRVAAQWTATASGEEGNDGSMRGFVVDVLQRLNSLIEDGTCVVKLDTLKRFLTEATASTNFNEAAAATFETEKMAFDCEIRVANPGRSTTTAKGFTVGLQSSPDSCKGLGRHRITEDPEDADDDEPSDGKLLRKVRRIEVSTLPSKRHNEALFCYSFRTSYSIDCGDDKTINEEDNNIAMDHVDPETDASMHMFSLGVLGSGERMGVTHVFPFKHHDAFSDRETKTKDIQATVTIRQLPMRCLVLYCLRLMIMEGHWDDIQAMGSAITDQVSACMAAYLARVKAPGVSPLRVLTSWLAGREPSMPLHDFSFAQICRAAVTEDVFNAHRSDVVPFIRTVGRLGPLGMLVDHADGLMATILASILEDSGCDAVGEGGRPHKRRRVEL
ncbi:unnamed protein product [Vitrella brassicaformis CCMP3155]|uniref:Uncharacterized protein n=3 Tax=Vitrella brassicaformis TaxID=1169539 RepID=A0A0G4FVR1_VITBC|nr:unnamed protein product [Vitrella brassicaformis CCMP3155]|eukprot:CEM18666.1 unnamed protein product [Vitrella brassicaformis CCMP3155]